MRIRRLLLVAMALGVGTLAWPSSVGGATAYVRSYGNSMEPSVRAGDLAVVRRARSYHVGDVVAYRSPQLGRVVLHRIVGRHGDAFVFRGDSNGFPDAEHLGPDHVLGRLALRVPRGGAVLLWLGNPLHAAALAAAASIVPGTVRRRGRRRLHNPQSIRGISMNADNIARGRAAAPWVAVAGAALVLLGAVAFSRSPSRTVAEPVAFTHNGSFAYSAPPSVPLYPEGFTTGDAIFTRLADRVTVGFTYHVDSEAAVAIDGTVRVDAVLSGAGGWRRVVPVLGPRAIQPGDTEVEVELNLPALHALAAEADAVAGTAAGGLRVGVTPSVDFDGTVAGQEVAGRFAPVLDFTLEATALRLVTPAKGDADRIEQTQASTVDVATSRATDVALPLAGLGLPVATARIAGPVGGVALLLLAAALARTGRRRGDGEPARIAARYGHLLVPIRDAADLNLQAVDVLTIGDLVRLARHHEQLVTHHVDADGVHLYVVCAGGTAYRYRPGHHDAPAAACRAQAILGGSGADSAGGALVPATSHDPAPDDERLPVEPAVPTG